MSSRNHGTAMASLIIHGDLTSPGEPLDRPLYVRPIMRPHDFVLGHEQVIQNRLLTDLLHRAVRRIVEGEAGREAAAPSVRIVNLSIGAQAGPLRAEDESGRAVAGLAGSHVQPAVRRQRGQHTGPDRDPADAATIPVRHAWRQPEPFRTGHCSRGVLPPGDAINALT